jgi:uncharacterized protein (DUF983 family)
MIVAPRDRPIPRCPNCGTGMKLWTIFLRPEILSFRCEACDETVRLVEGEWSDLPVRLPPRRPYRPPVVAGRA